ncbi:MAG: FAD:protein FMN transferase [Capnocytophaga sp.]|nr:FAD:protein FMN transferase [Capnocytophaga sp.]
MKNLAYLSVFIFFFSCQIQEKEKQYAIHGEAQGTTYTITYISENPVKKQSIDSILQVIDFSMSTYIDNSLITKINKNEHLPIDAHFKKVFLASKQIFEESDGYFDPSIGVLINAWGFGKKESHIPPTQQQIDSLLLRIGLDKITLSSEDYLEKKNKDISLNFNAIAQGYTSDVIADFLLSKQITNFIVEVGGELSIHGKNTLKNKSWVIGIDNPLQKPDEEREVIVTLNLENCGLATSGNYRKLWVDEKTGKKYVHTINPKTGYPEQSNLLSATVIAPSAMLADGYATTLMALGLEKSKQFLEKHKDLKAILLYNDEENPTIIQEYTTNNLEINFEK